MSENVSDSMPEYMPEQMSDTMVSKTNMSNKSLDFMEEITRNEVIDYALFLSVSLVLIRNCRDARRKLSMFAQ